MTKKYKNGSQLYESVFEGANELTNNVASTLGPRGRNVILQAKDKVPIITKDGVTIAKFVSLEDPFKNAVAQIIKQAAMKTSEEVGDGTTTSTVLTRAILREAQKYIRSGVSPVELKRGMDKATEAIVDFLKKNSIEISSKEEMENVATISANGDRTIGALIAMAVDQAGKDGAVSIEDARSTETSLDLIEGFIFDSGYVSPHFITNQKKGTIEHENCLIFVTDHKLNSIDEMLPLLELIARESKPCVIVADEIEGQFLAALIANAMRGTMKVAAVKAPRYGEERRGILSDLAISTGAHFFKRESGTSLKEVKLKHFGKAKKIEISKKQTTIAGGQADYEKIEQQIETLKEQIKQEGSISTCERIQERITRLASGVAIIKVGATTQIEMIEKKHRIEDALEAVRAAQIYGVHAGGGLPLIRASSEIELPKDLPEPQLLGFKIILESIKEPLRQMAINAGESPDLIISKVLASSGNDGWDFSSNKLVDMVEEGIIDPVGVTVYALKAAVSVASTLLTTGYAIIET